MIIHIGEELLKHKLHLVSKIFVPILISDWDSWLTHIFAKMLYFCHFHSSFLDGVWCVGSGYIFLFLIPKDIEYFLHMYYPLNNYWSFCWSSLVMLYSTIWSLGVLCAGDKSCVCVCVCVCWCEPVLIEAKDKIKPFCYMVYMFCGVSDIFLI